MSEYKENRPWNNKTFILLVVIAVVTNALAWHPWGGG